MWLTRSSRPNWFNRHCIHFFLDGMNESLSLSVVSSVIATGNEELKMMTEKRHADQGRILGSFHFGRWWAKECQMPLNVLTYFVTMENANKHQNGLHLRFRWTMTYKVQIEWKKRMLSEWYYNACWRRHNKDKNRLQEKTNKKCSCTLVISNASNWVISNASCDYMQTSFLIHRLFLLIPSIPFCPFVLFPAYRSYPDAQLWARLYFTKQIKVCLSQMLKIIVFRVQTKKNRSG